MVLNTTKSILSQLIVRRRKKLLNSFLCGCTGTISHHKNSSLRLLHDVPTFLFPEYHHRHFSSRAKKKIDNNELETTENFLVLSPNMVKHVLSKKERHDEILTLLNQPGQQHNSGDLGKEFSSLAQISHFYTKLMEIHEEKISVQELLDEASQDENDEDSRLMIQECEEDITRLDSICTRLEKNILKSIIPKDPEDFESDAILEIRAGTGGDEATLFAFELFQTYEKLIKNRGFQYEILSMGKISGAVAGVKGGLKEASISITSPGGGGNSYGGNNFSSVDYDSIDNDDDLDTEDEFEDNSFLMELGPYGFFKYESGVHRGEFYLM